MCDQATQTILDKIISNWVSEQKMFTALSVSREAQRNYGVTLRHNEMKNETHRVYASGTMGSHERMLVTLPGINGQAWAYFPQGINPENYDLIPLLNGPIDCKDTKIDPPAPNMQVSIPDPFARIKVSRQKSSSLMSSITPRSVSGEGLSPYENTDLMEKAEEICVAVMGLADLVKDIDPAIVQFNVDVNVADKEFKKIIAAAEEVKKAEDIYALYYKKGKLTAYEPTDFAEAHRESYTDTKHSGLVIGSIIALSIIFAAICFAVVAVSQVR